MIMDLPKAHDSLKDLIKYADYFGLEQIKIESELLLCEGQIKIKEYGQAMVLITKTLASL